MSHPGVPQHSAADHASPETTPLWVLLVAVVVMLAGAGAVVGALLYDGKAEAAPSYPDTWDARVAPYVKVTEKHRGLRFKHPVKVRFLSAAEFEKGVTSDKDELGKEDRQEIEQFTGLMRAFGLIKGDVDLFKATNDLSGAGTLAYYSFEDERITIRGEKVTPAVRSTVVHELTHVLQDQHFAIGDRMKKLEKAEKSETTSEASVLKAIVEGDASRVETVYRASLSAKQRKALDKGQKNDVAQFSAKLAKIPKVIITLMSSPYTLGEALVQAVAAKGGNTEVDDLFRNAPTHESSLLDPLQALAGNTEAAKVDKPALGDGEKKFDSGEFGVVTWYLMLAERLPLVDALAAADGWGGDAYVAFEREGASCARVSYVGDSPLDTGRMLTSLQRWVAAAPGSPAKVSLESGLVRFESCDPGKAAKVGKDASEDAVALVATRAYLGVGLIRSGLKGPVARCMSAKMAREYSVPQLTDPAFGKDDPAIKAQLQLFALRCR